MEKTWGRAVSGITHGQSRSCQCLRMGATRALSVAGAAQRLSQRPDSGAAVGGGDVVKMSGGAVVRGALDRTAAKAWSDFLQSL